MNFGSLLGGSTTKPDVDPGLQPNKFQLQMMGPGSSITPRAAPIGFGPGAHTMAAQTAGLSKAGFGAPPPAPMPGPAENDPWANMGPIGQFFKLIMAANPNSGMPSPKPPGNLGGQ